MIYSHVLLVASHSGRERRWEYGGPRERTRRSQGSLALCALRLKCKAESFIGSIISVRLPERRANQMLQKPGQYIEGLPNVDESWVIKREHLIFREEIGKGMETTWFWTSCVSLKGDLPRLKIFISPHLLCPLLRPCWWLFSLYFEAPL